MDLVTCLPMLFGVHVAENFDRPFLAASPSDLWSRRWNFWFHDFVRREVFLPLRRSRRLAVLATFAVSGLAHEYLIIASLGTSRGQMLAFFLLQAVAVLLSHRRARSLPRGLGCVLHTGWLILTIPLFLEPILQIVPLSPHSQ
jgi:D-alanyl-lipoteichoic acid acyltransferase DltB (MBOAT superfamily)